jgi:hypothetical protein
MKFKLHSLCWLHPFIDYSDYWFNLLDTFCHQERADVYLEVRKRRGAYIFWMKQVPVHLSLRVSAIQVGQDTYVLILLSWSLLSVMLMTEHNIPVYFKSTMLFCPYENLHQVRKRTYVSCLFVIFSLTQLYRSTPEIFLFSTATSKYKYRVPLRRIGQEYSVKVAFSILPNDRPGQDSFAMNITLNIVSLLFLPAMYVKCA